MIVSALGQSMLPARRRLAFGSWPVVNPTLQQFLAKLIACQRHKDTRRKIDIQIDYGAASSRRQFPSTTTPVAPW
ncbi:MAG: hypothetical protein ACI9IV_001136 [Paracoccaceae bacterium]|jgi:hypothetical protein|tara:strand:+ start:351 stop:575 length:225 start_codon:yes stop_codon:yes gene_type:complete